jgi:hypothetical protein
LEQVRDTMRAAVVTLKTYHPGQGATTSKPDKQAGREGSMDPD